MSLPEHELILRQEFEAHECSFLLQLRCELIWDKVAFSRLIFAMESCASAEADAKTFPRWMAEGFWYLDHFVRDWSSHPNFPKNHPPDYYEAAYERLHDLAFWFFFGQSPYNSSLLPL